VLFYLNTLVHVLLAVPTLVMPYRAVVGVAKMWGRTNLWLLRRACALDVEWQGLEKIPPGGLIVAAKHQSAWETFALLTLLDDPVFILKRELMWIPVFGWCLWKGGMIPVDRGGGRSALTAMTARARAAIAGGRQIIIFPEGTRRPPGAPPAYKYGIVHLYESVAVPCLPVALNSGVHWPRRSFLRWPGTIVIEILPPLPKGLPRDQILPTLQDRIETATNRLVAASQRELGFAVTAATPSARQV
jgi:1-acyl-sn-glycerol-3-phosphate acyltransferase